MGFYSHRQKLNSVSAKIKQRITKRQYVLVYNSTHAIITLINQYYIQYIQYCTILIRYYIYIFRLTIIYLLLGKPFYSNLLLEVFSIILYSGILIIELTIKADKTNNINSVYDAARYSNIVNNIANNTSINIVINTSANIVINIGANIVSDIVNNIVNNIISIVVGSNIADSRYLVYFTNRNYFSK